MEKLELEVKPENMIAFAEVIADADLSNEVIGISDDNEKVLMEISYNPKNKNHKKAIISLEELSEDSEDNEESEEEEDDDDQE